MEWVSGDLRDVKDSEGPGHAPTPRLLGCTEMPDSMHITVHSSTGSSSSKIQFKSANCLDRNWALFIHFKWAFSPLSAAADEDHDQEEVMAGTVTQDLSLLE